MKPAIVMMLGYLYLFMAGCGGSSGGSESDSSRPSLPAQRLFFADSGQLGVFDPSIARDPATQRLWMSYSAVDASRYYPTDRYWSVSIRLAFSDDGGETWHDAGHVVAEYTEPLVGGPLMDVTAPAPPIDANSQGIWQSETSSLIYDPDAAPGERWKLIWFQYLNADLESYFLDYSWIAMKTAATPLDLAAATPVKLFAGFGLQDDGEIGSEPAYSPIGTPPAIRLNADLTTAPGGADVTELEFCVFAEPGLHAADQALYLAMFCMDVSTTTQYIVAFECPSPCNITDPAAWEYMGRLLSPDDAAAIGRDHFQAPAIATARGRTFLLVTPVETTTGNRYDGCRVYELVGPAMAELLTDAGGRLTEIRRIDGQANSHHGACDTIDGLQGGIIYSQFEPAGAPETFRLYKSQIFLPQ